MHDRGMRLLWLAALLGALALASLAEARDTAQAPGAVQARAIVRTVLDRNRDSCGYRVLRSSAVRAGTAWRVTATLTGSVRGRAVWVVRGKRARPANALARRIVGRCPVATPPPPPPAPPPPSPPPPPSAPASYVFGAEVAPETQASVRRNIDAAAEYFRVRLGRPLPAIGVWAFRDVERMIAAYAENRPTTIDDARRLWQGGQVGHATLRKIWLGPPWFTTPDSAKIAAHELFHVLQYEVVGERALGVSGLDEVPRAGPWWLAEGTAELFAFLVVVQDGRLTLEGLRARWAQAARASDASLATLTTLRGQREVPRAYDLYALAAELLLRGRDPASVFAYYDAIARGVPWADAFSATFGRTHEAFVAEYDAYRRTL